MNRPYLTVKDVAAMWGTPKGRVHRAVQEGLLPVAHVGKFPRFKPEWVPPRPPEKPRRLPQTPQCGVYMLWLAGSLTYVGRSTNLTKRLCTHRNSPRVFDEVRIIPCDEPTAAWLEAELVRTLQPPENIKRFVRRTKRIEAALEAVALT